MTVKDDEQEGEQAQKTRFVHLSCINDNYATATK